ncbi:MAG: hypothetical protein JO112_09175 [Planctomycetes bacterium]|nr:hypothetical protein [Planctomycetota bacterium]
MRSRFSPMDWVFVGSRPGLLVLTLGLVTLCGCFPSTLAGTVAPFTLRPQPVLPGSPLVPVSPRVVTGFLQVAPDFKGDPSLHRSRNQGRAIVLLHGLQLHPFTAHAEETFLFRDWQKPGSHLVQELSKKGDVFAFSYSQNAPVPTIAAGPDLGWDIQRLRNLGYSDIVLIGHSAGGLIARQFVEDHPEAGVTKVIQVCAPNAGSNYARIETGVSKDHRAFLESLTREARMQCLRERAHKIVPPGVQFVCVVGDGAGVGDGVVSTRSQWPLDLQEQGIPMIPLRTSHFTVMRSRTEAVKLAEIVASYYPRWDGAQVAVAKKKLRED